MSFESVFIASILAPTVSKFFGKHVFAKSVTLTQKLRNERVRSILLTELNPARRRARASIRGKDVLVD